MLYQYSVERGQPGILDALYNARVPVLNGYVYNTHAPYDPLADESTLILGAMGPTKKHPACSSAFYIPEQSLTVTSLIDLPAKRLKIGNELGNPYKTITSIGSVTIHATYNETGISFYGINENSSRFVDFEDLGVDSAIVGAGSLLYATQAKLINQMVAGHDFAA